MVLPVVSEMVLSPEALVADVTRIRSLVRVSPLVDEEIVGLGEVSSAVTTDELSEPTRAEIQNITTHTKHTKSI